MSNKKQGKYSLLYIVLLVVLLFILGSICTFADNLIGWHSIYGKILSPIFGKTIDDLSFRKINELHPALYDIITSLTALFNYIVLVFVWLVIEKAYRICFKSILDENDKFKCNSVTSLSIVIWYILQFIYYKEGQPRLYYYNLTTSIILIWIGLFLPINDVYNKKTKSLAKALFKPIKDGISSSNYNKFWTLIALCSPSCLLTVMLHINNNIMLYAQNYYFVFLALLILIYLFIKKAKKYTNEN